jgi:hypothetical protein
MPEVTDPELLGQLNAPSSSAVTDPALLAQLNAPESRSTGDIATSALHEAVKPLTSLPSTYADINREAREQMATGAGQLANPQSNWDYLKGAGNIVGGGLNYVASPITAPMRSFASRPLEETTGIPKEYTEFALSLLPWMPKGTGVVRAGEAASVPTAQALEQTAEAGFKGARESGISVPATDVASIAQKAQTVLHNNGYREYLAPKTYAALAEMQNAPEGAIADVADLHGMRRVLGNAAGSPDATERSAAKAVQKALDTYLTTLSPELKDAISNYAALKRSETVTGKLEQAQEATGAANSGMNLGNAIRQRFKSILLDPKQQRGFTDEEIGAMRSIVRGTYTQNALRIAGNILGGGGGLGSLAAAAAGAHAEGMAGAIGFPAMGMGIRQLGNAMTMRKVNELDEMIRARSPLGESMAASQGERDAAAQWAKDYVNAGAHPSMGNLRALNASSRGLALILQRDLGTDATKTLPFLQSPMKGQAEEPQQEVPRPPPQQHDGGKVEEPQRAHGGKVDAKVSKASVHYRGGVKDRRCGVCTMYVKPNGCTAVRGSISPHALCDLFERKH